MITCKECGFTSARLQWTHFRYNCSGRFKNGKEYQAVYPDELLVSPELAKKTAVTLDNLIKKYGDVEGRARWDQYRQKQAETNSYEHKKQKFNWTEKQYLDYNKSRAATLENMISRHGEEEGIKKWEKYCERQSYTKSKKYFIDRYGEQEGLEKYLEILKKKTEPHDPKNIAEKYSISLDEAVSLICSKKSFIASSSAEREFVSLLEKYTGELENTSQKQPYGKWCSLLNRYVVYDIRHKDCIIEFNGDYWHANPLIYGPNDLIKGVKASDIWYKDKMKIEEAINSGYRTLVVWEHDYKKDKDGTAKKVAEWILNEQKSNQ